MPSAARFILKDSPAIMRSMVDHDDKIQGRIYSSERAKHPGGIRVAEIALGLQFSCLAISDDQPNTLKKVAAVNPWQQVAMEIIAGSKEKAHQPLTQLLSDIYNLETDHIINVQGMSSAGHPLDTQGYIAHNDTTIVLAYRCTTTAADWLTNLNTTTSAWEIDIDLAQGHSGFFSSCCDYAICVGSDSKPRVHTGFYNNFLCSIPFIRKYLDPLLLSKDQPPRTLYVAGHSLGAGIATLAACYFLLESDRYDWAVLPHKLRVVTAGGPRAVTRHMQTLVEQECDRINNVCHPGKVQLLRVVRDKDVVPTVPPTAFGFCHVPQQMIFLTKEDTITKKCHILIHPNRKHVVPKRIMKQLMRDYPSLLLHQAASWGGESSLGNDPQEDNSDDDDLDEVNSSFAMEKDSMQRNMPGFKFVPRPLRDHMPQFYLTPVMAQLEEEQTPQIYLDPALAVLLDNSTKPQDDEMTEATTTTLDETARESSRTPFRYWLRLKKKSNHTRISV